MANFNNQAKRKRELAKQRSKRAAKDRKRAQRKAEARGATAPAPASPTT